MGMPTKSSRYLRIDAKIYPCMYLDMHVSILICAHANVHSDPLPFMEDFM